MIAAIHAMALIIGYALLAGLSLLALIFFVDFAVPVARELWAKACDRAAEWARGL